MGTLFRAASELTALAAAMARSARLPMLQRRRALPTAVAVAKVDHSDTAKVCIEEKIVRPHIYICTLRGCTSRFNTRLALTEM